MRKPGVVKYRKKRGEILEFAYTFGSNGFGGCDWDGEYYEFTNTETNEKLKISPSKLAPGEKIRLDEEWHKAPYREKVANLEEIVLSEWRDYGEGRWTGTPENFTGDVWNIRGCSDREAVIFELTDGAVLNIMNNSPRTITGTTFREALKKLFPDKKIKILVPTVRVEELARQRLA